MTIGRFDEDLFRRFRAATGVTRRQLLDQLVRENEPLVKVIVAQKLGRGEQKPGRRFGKAMVAAETVTWEDAMQAGRMALVKALDGLDATKGKLSSYLAWKVLYELQVLIGVEQPMKPERGHEAEVAESVFRFDHAHELEQAIHENHAVETIDDDQEVDDEPRRLPRGEPSNDVRGDEPYASSVESFLATRCAFAPPARAASVTVLASYERHALEIGRPAVDARCLGAALRARGARPTWLRVPWLDRPARGWRGIRVQTDAARTA